MARVGGGSWDQITTSPSGSGLGTSVLLLGTGFRAPRCQPLYRAFLGSRRQQSSLLPAEWGLENGETEKGLGPQWNSPEFEIPAPSLSKMGFTEQTRLLPRVRTLRPESAVPTLNLHASPKPGRHRLGERGEEERGEDGEAGGRSWCQA